MKNWKEQYSFLGTVYHIYRPQLNLLFLYKCRIHPHGFFKFGKRFCPLSVISGTPRWVDRQVTHVKLRIFSCRITWPGRHSRSRVTRNILMTQHNLRPYNGSFIPPRVFSEQVNTTLMTVVCQRQKKELYSVRLKKMNGVLDRLCVNIG